MMCGFYVPSRVQTAQSLASNVEQAHNQVSSVMLRKSSFSISIFKTVTYSIKTNLQHNNKQIEKKNCSSRIEHHADECWRLKNVFVT